MKLKTIYISIQVVETGHRIHKLMDQRGYNVKDIQTVMGFEHPQAVYKWLSGQSLPTLDNMYILSKTLDVTIEDILVVDGDVSFYDAGVKSMIPRIAPCFALPQSYKHS